MSGSQQINVLIYGLGAIGSFYAFILSRKENVCLTVVARSNYDAVKAKGLTLRSENHGDHVVMPQKVVKSAFEAGSTFDYVVCAHKALDQAAVPAQIAAAVSNNTTIVIIQNGVGNEEPFRDTFPEATIVSCVTWVVAIQTEPGVITHTKSEDMQMGLFPNEMNNATIEKQRLEQFSSLLVAGKTPFQVVSDIQVQRWEKVVWNTAWNTLTTLTLMSPHEWLSSSPDAVPITRRLMIEVIHVARGCGVPIEYELADRQIEKLLAMSPPVYTSMMVDFQNGRPMEVEIIMGYTVKKGRELGLSTPTIDAIYTILKAINKRFCASSTN